MKRIGSIGIDPDEANDSADALAKHDPYIDEMSRRLTEVASFCQAPGAGAAVVQASVYRQVLEAVVALMYSAADAAKKADTDPDVLADMANLRSLLHTLPAPSVSATVAAVLNMFSGNAVPIADDDLLPDLMPGTGYVDLSEEEFWGDDRVTAPNSEDINQGSLGDCWLLAVLASVANDEQAIRRLVTLNGDGTATVRLPSGDVEVPLSELSASNGGNAPWVRAVEWAYAQQSGDYEDLVGDNAKRAFADVFGADTEVFRPEPDGPTTYDPDRTQDLGPTQSVDRLQAAIAAGKPATVSVHDKIGVEGHEFSVEEVQVDPHTGERTIIIRNPWGRHDASPAELAKHDVQDLGDGRLAIPEDEFAEVATRVSVGQL